MKEINNSCYSAEEFAELVNYDNVREYLPLGTKIKMVPNSSEITDAYIEFELVAYKHYRLADGSDMAKTTWLAVNLLNKTRWMNFNGTNHGGWAECELRDWMNEMLYPSLPDYWKNLMRRARSPASRISSVQESRERDSMDTGGCDHLTHRQNLSIMLERVIAQNMLPIINMACA